MNAKNLDLFPERAPRAAESRLKPLADLLRPASWESFQGIEALDRNLITQLRAGKGRPPSLILWGPPGCGKTTLAKLIGGSYNARFIEFSAVLGGVKEVREIVAEAEHAQLPTILFVDEIHRFTKAQQDAFLPHVEKGTVSLIGATTENPSFYLTGALLSRAKVLAMPSIGEGALRKIIERAAEELKIKFADDAASILILSSGGDARKLLNLIESIRDASIANSSGLISSEALRNFLSDAKTPFYDRSGDEHYQMASAFIKSLRGSDPDAALYWGFRMIDSGEEPRFIIRRLMIFAAEDIGNADPRALMLAVSTMEAFERIGIPEGRIPIAQCITYLATSPKSNRSYAAMNKAISAIKENPKVSVPMHLRNAPTNLMKSMGYGADYQYPHDSEGGYVPDLQYLPDECKDAKFYEPSDRGYEDTIRLRMNQLRSTGKK